MLFSLPFPKYTLPHFFPLEFCSPLPSEHRNPKRNPIKISTGTQTAAEMLKQRTKEPEIHKAREPESPKAREEENLCAREPENHRVR
jgi:hypothetical protein